MTNDLYTFLAELKRTLKALSSFKYVGWFPYADDIKKAITDGNAPSILIEEGEEGEAEIDLTLSLNKAIEVGIWIYHDTRQLQVKTMTDLQTEIETAVLSSAFLESSGAYCVNWVSVEKGD